MAKIIIVGLGPAEDGLLTVQAMNTLKTARLLLLKTLDHPITSLLAREKIAFDSLVNIAAEAPDLEEPDDRICRKLVGLAGEHKEVIVAVPGHPLVGQSMTSKLVEQCQNSGVAIEVITSLDFLDLPFPGSGGDIAKGLQVIDASRISRGLITPGLDLVITRVSSRSIARDLKPLLLCFYPPDVSIIKVQIAETEARAGLISLPLTRLDRHNKFSPRTSLYLPASSCSAGASLESLVEVMGKLRGPDGCPWDREQTHSSIKRHLIEESHEVIEAIDTRNGGHLKEELGDLLLQIVFHAQIADESGDFDIHDVLEGIVRKLIGRHPHIFGDKEAETPEDVVVHWEEAKRKEGKTRILSGIPPSLPALLYALKLQKKAARVGFDWKEKEDVIDKLFEEVEELKKVCTQGEDRKELEEEIGDILFSVVNIARHFGIEPEDALGRTLKKFRRRFEYIENEAEKKNILLADMFLEEKEMLWQEAKKSERD